MTKLTWCIWALLGRLAASNDLVMVWVICVVSWYLGSLLLAFLYLLFGDSLVERELMCSSLGSLFYYPRRL